VFFLLPKIYRGLICDHYNTFVSDFDDWNTLKKKVNDKEHIPLIQEGDI